LTVSLTVRGNRSAASGKFMVTGADGSCAIASGARKLLSQGAIASPKQSTYAENNHLQNDGQVIAIPPS